MKSSSLLQAAAALVLLAASSHAGRFCLPNMKGRRKGLLNTALLSPSAGSGHAFGMTWLHRIPKSQRLIMLFSPGA